MREKFNKITKFCNSWWRR